MKKKLLIALLPVLMLASCKNVSEASAYVYGEEEGVPTIRTTRDSGTHKTYLMMSKYGYLDIDGVETHGGDIPEKYYENCIIWAKDVGEALPTKEEVKSSVSGVKFRGWAIYKDNVFPEYLTTVPEANESTLYAIFDGPTGGGTNTGGGGGSTPVESFSATFSVDLAIFNGWENINTFSLYLWGDNGQEPLGDWNSCFGNLTGSGNIKSVTVSNITYKIIGAVFFFNQGGAIKQTTDISCSISKEGEYVIAPNGPVIQWESGDNPKMTNFTISKK